MQISRSIQCLVFAASVCLFAIHRDAFAAQPNVIFFAVDDLCDWVGPLGYEQAITPHMDSLARRGVVFSNAHCPGTFCAPSRSAIFSGRFASTTGCYTTEVYFHDHPELRPLQSSFQKGGFATFGAGKLFHHGAGYLDARGWDEFFVRSEQQRRGGWPMDSWGDGTPIPQPYPNSAYNKDRKPANRFFLEWGAVPNEREEEMADTIRANWACDVLRRKHDRPFFLAVGLYAPHFPNYAPQKYFDLYDPAKIKAPPYKVDDLDDLPPKVRKAKTNRSRIHQRLVEIGAVEDAIHGYLASVSYADAMLGRILTTLRESPHHENTVVVLWSDHGYHHGEKGDWGKHTLWERTSNVPFIWAGPGIEHGSTVDSTVSLIDMYPTFVEMCDLPNVEGLEGTSLAGTLREPATATDRNVLLPYLAPGGYAVINRQWRYIHYSDNSEELYDVRKDPNEWNNLADHATFADIKQKLQAGAPKSFALPGTPKNRLRLVTNGEAFHWELKTQKKRAASEIKPPVTKVAKTFGNSGGQPKLSASFATSSIAVDVSTLNGKVMVGYQGWFNCPGDGARLGWKHWTRSRKNEFGPGNVTVDLWPDVSELDAEERYATGFKRADGSAAEVFSSANRKTVLRHFRWMRDYGIDGAFLQRFATGLSGPASLRNNNTVLSHVREGAKQSGRTFAVMYDLSGLKAGQVKRVCDDWTSLRSELKVTSDANYLHHNGKPLVAVWGIGFSDDRKYSLRECHDLVKWLKSDGCSVMLGVPSFWREGRRDATDDPLLHQIIKEAEVISPWTIGRYRTPDEAARHATDVWQPDRQWCQRERLDFLPVVFPGFSWHNLNGGKLDQIPRLKGDFLWSQVTAAKRVGCNMLYVAMFDEVDEGTAIFKCTNEPPTGDDAKFLTYEGLPSDHYLKLAGRAGKLLRNELPTGDQQRSESRQDFRPPIKPTKLSASSATSASKSKPNILFIVCDDLNTHVSLAGYAPISTPSLDALAKQSMTFHRAFCQYPVCGPSRASFLSGLYPQSTGVLNNTADIRTTRPGTLPMPQFFKENGYWTASVGKVFHSPRHEQGETAWNEFHRFENDELPVVAAERKKFEAEHGSVDQGKNRKAWRALMKSVAAPLNAQTPPGHGPSGLTDEQHKDGKNVRQVISWLEKKSYGDKPFFIACGIQKPHVPFLAPKKYFEQYPLDRIVYQPDEPNLWDGLPKTAMSKRYEAFGFELGKENDARRREYMQAYHACISFIDAQIGSMLKTLKEKGLWENTIVVFTSDHGYHLGDHFLWGKVTLFDIGAKVPFIVHAPGLTGPGSKSEAMVELIDIYPTLAELTGLPAPEHLQGKSLVPLLKHPERMGQKKYAYSVVSRGKQLGYALRNQRWRYGKWLDGEELYDLTRDPEEKRNLANRDDQATRLQEFRDILKRKQTEAMSAFQ